jgi:hypothetical protein
LFMQRGQQARKQCLFVLRRYYDRQFVRYTH